MFFFGHTILDLKGKYLRCSAFDLSSQKNKWVYYLFYEKETLGKSTAWFFGIIFKMPKQVYWLQKFPSYDTANNLMCIIGIFKFNFSIFFLTVNSWQQKIKKSFGDLFQVTVVQKPHILIKVCAVEFYLFAWNEYVSISCCFYILLN